MIINRNARGFYVFDMNTSYKAGDVVYFEGMLYLATVNVTGKSPLMRDSGFVEWIKYDVFTKEQVLNYLDTQFIYRGEIPASSIDSVTSAGIYKVSGGTYNGINFTYGWLRITPTSQGNFTEFVSNTHNFIKTPNGNIRYTDITKDENGNVRSSVLAQLTRSISTKLQLQDWIKTTIERKVTMNPDPVTEISGRQVKIPIKYKGDMIMLSYKINAENKYSSEIMTALVESDWKDLLTEVVEDAQYITYTMKAEYTPVKGIVFKYYGN